MPLGAFKISLAVIALLKGQELGFKSLHRASELLGFSIGLTAECTHQFVIFGLEMCNHDWLDPLLEMHYFDHPKLLGSPIAPIAHLQCTMQQSLGALDRSGYFYWKSYVQICDPFLSDQDAFL